MPFVGQSQTLNMPTATIDSYAFNQCTDGGEIIQAFLYTFFGLINKPFRVMMGISGSPKEEAGVDANKGLQEGDVIIGEFVEMVGERNAAAEMAARNAEGMEGGKKTKKRAHKSRGSSSTESTNVPSRSPPLSSSSRGSSSASTTVPSSRSSSSDNRNP